MPKTIVVYLYNLLFLWLFNSCRGACHNQITDSFPPLQPDTLAVLLGHAFSTVFTVFLTMGLRLFGLVHQE